MGGDQMKFRFVLPVILILSLSPLITSIAQDQPARFESPTFGYSVVIPDDWRVYSELKSDTMGVVDFSLPPTWSKVEKQDIKNAVSVITFKKSDIKSVQDVVDLEEKRTAKVVVSKSDVKLDFGRARRVKSIIRGQEYHTMEAFRFENGIGYLFIFTATKGTYDINIKKFTSFLSTVEFFPPRAEAEPEFKSAYEEALALHGGGPENLPKVISILENELNINPENLKAAKLLGLTYYETGRYEEAVVMFDSSIRMDDGINPHIYLYKGRSLAKLGRYQELKKCLGGMGAFYQGDDELSAAYEELMAQIPKSESDSPDTTEGVTTDQMDVVDDK
jgi:hypothetical protein